MRGHSKFLMDSLPLVKLDDKELREHVAKAQKGDDAARDIVLCAVMRRVYWLAQRYERVDLIDDMIQEGAMAVLCAIEKFDEDRAANSSFIFYASLWVKSRIRNYLKKEVQIRTHDKVEYKSMDEPLVDDERRLHDVLESGGPTPDEQCQMSHDKTVLLELMERLNDNERDAIVRTFGIGVEKEPRDEYAKLCGVTGQTIYNRVQSGIRKLRKMAEEGMTK